MRSLQFALQANPGFFDQQTCGPVSYTHLDVYKRQTQCSNCPNRSCNNIKFATIYPVIYSDKRFNATSYGQWYVEQYLKNTLGISEIAPYNDNFLFVKAALHKSSDWAYETEWRIICSTPNPAVESRDRYPITKRPIAIYFGCQIPEIYRKMLINLSLINTLSKTDSGQSYCAAR